MHNLYENILKFVEFDRLYLLIKYLLIKIQICEDVRVENVTFLLIVARGWCGRDQGDGDGDGEDSQEEF